MAHEQIEHIDYRFWEDFKSNIANELFDNGVFIRGRYLFRGQRNANWALVPSFDRQYHEFDIIKRKEIEMELLEEFENEADGSRFEIPKLSHDSLLAFVQHHGMPTRLLDWTLSPYVAAFFAFEDAVLSSQFSGKVAIWALDTSSGIWTKELGVTIVDPPKLGNRRLRNQQGKFTLMQTPFDSLDKYVKHQPHDIGQPLKKLMIQTSEAPKAISDLDLMGLNHGRLFPGPEGSVKAARMRISLSLYVEAMLSI